MNSLNALAAITAAGAATGAVLKIRSYRKARTHAALQAAAVHAARKAIFLDSLNAPRHMIDAAVKDAQFKIIIAENF